MQLHAKARSRALRQTRTGIGLGFPKYGEATHTHIVAQVHCVLALHRSKLRGGGGSHTPSNRECQPPTWNHCHPLHEHVSPGTCTKPHPQGRQSSRGSRQTVPARPCSRGGGTHVLVYRMCSCPLLLATAPAAATAGLLTEGGLACTACACCAVGPGSCTGGWPPDHRASLHSHGCTGSERKTRLAHLELRVPYAPANTLARSARHPPCISRA